MCALLVGRHDIVVVQWERVNYQVQLAPILAVILIFALSIWLAILRAKNTEAEMYLNAHSVYRNGSIGRDVRS